MFKENKTNLSPIYVRHAEIPHSKASSRTHKRSSATSTYHAMACVNIKLHAAFVVAYPYISISRAARRRRWAHTKRSRCRNASGRTRQPRDSHTRRRQRNGRVSRQESRCGPVLTAFRAGRRAKMGQRCPRRQVRMTFG